MFDDAFTNFEGEIEPFKPDIAMFKMFDDAERVKVVVEASPVRAHQFVKPAFAGMAEGRMANIVNQSQRFDQIGIQRKCACNGACDLRHFQGVRQSIAKMVGKAGGEYLGLGFESAKGARMNDAVAIAGVLAAIGMWRFRKAAAANGIRRHSPRRVEAIVYDGRGLQKK